MWIPTLEQATRRGFRLYPTERTEGDWATRDWASNDDATTLGVTSLLVVLGVPTLFLRETPLAMGLYFVLWAVGMGVAMNWGSIRGARVARRMRREFERAGTIPGTARFVGEVIAVVDAAEDAPAITVADVVGARRTTNPCVATLRAFVLRGDDGRLAWVEQTEHALVRLSRLGDVGVGSRVEVRGTVRREALPALVRLEGYREVPTGEVFYGVLDRPLFVQVD